MISKLSLFQHDQGLIFIHTPMEISKLFKQSHFSVFCALGISQNPFWWNVYHNFKWLLFKVLLPGWKSIRREGKGISLSALYPGKSRNHLSSQPWGCIAPEYEELRSYFLFAPKIERLRITLWNWNQQPKRENCIYFIARAFTGTLRVFALQQIVTMCGIWISFRLFSFSLY